MSAPRDLGVCEREVFNTLDVLDGSLFVQKEFRAWRRARAAELAPTWSRTEVAQREHFRRKVVRLNQELRAHRSRGPLGETLGADRLPSKEVLEGWLSAPVDERRAHPDASSEAWRGPFNPSTDSLQFANAAPPSNTLGGLMTTLDVIKARTVTPSSNHAYLFYDHSAVADWKTAAYHALLTPWTAASDNRRLACAHGLEALATQWSRNREAGQGPFAASILPSLRDMCLFLERESPRNSPRLNSPLPQVR